MHGEPITLYRHAGGIAPKVGVLGDAGTVAEQTVIINALMDCLPSF